MHTASDTIFFTATLMTPHKFSLTVPTRGQSYTTVSETSTAGTTETADCNLNKTNWKQILIAQTFYQARHRNTDYWNTSTARVNRHTFTWLALCLITRRTHFVGFAVNAAKHDTKSKVGFLLLMRLQFQLPLHSIQLNSISFPLPDSWAEAIFPWEIWHNLTVSEKVFFTAYLLTALDAFLTPH